MVKSKPQQTKKTKQPKATTANKKQNKLKKKKEANGVSKQAEAAKTTDLNTIKNNGLANKKWINKQRVLLISSRGVSYLARHIMANLKTLMPHTKTDSKFDRKHGLNELSEIADIRNCNKIMYIEMHKKQDAYLWLSAQPHGPSAKFSFENLHTMEELKLTGNCLKGSRPILA